MALFRKIPFKELCVPPQMTTNAFRIFEKHMTKSSSHLFKKHTSSERSDSFQTSSEVHCELPVLFNSIPFITLSKDDDSVDIEMRCHFRVYHRDVTRYTKPHSSLNPVVLNRLWYQFNMRTNHYMVISVYDTINNINLCRDTLSYYERVLDDKTYPDFESDLSAFMYKLQQI